MRGSCDWTRTLLAWIYALGGATDDINADMRLHVYTREAVSALESSWHVCVVR